MTSEYVNACLDEFLDKEGNPAAELFVLEFTFNDLSKSNRAHITVNPSRYSTDVNSLFQLVSCAPRSPRLSYELLSSVLTNDS